MLALPKPDSRGWFEPVIGRAPVSWPWALPHLYAINVASEPKIEFVGASATPDGSLSLRQGLSADRSRIEVVGYWQDEFRILNVGYVSSRKRAEESAAHDFSCLPIRYLMHDGAVVQENAEVKTTGNWPAEWRIQRYQDLGVLCAFIFERAKQAGLTEEAEGFKQSIRPASPVTEQVMVYKTALIEALKLFSHKLPFDVTIAIQGALETIEGWYPQSVRQPE